MTSVVEGVGHWLYSNEEQRWSWWARPCSARLLGVEDRGHRVRDEVEHSIAGVPSMALVLGLARIGHHGAVGDIAASVWLGARKVHTSGWLTTTWPWLLPVMVRLEGM